MNYKWIDDVIRVSSKFIGDSDELRMLISFIVMGHLFGEKALRLFYSPKVFNKNIGFMIHYGCQYTFDKGGPFSFKSVGLKVTMRDNNYWRVVSGDVKSNSKRLINIPEFKDPTYVDPVFNDYPF